MYNTKIIKKSLIKKMNKYIRGTEMSFKDPDINLMNGCAILKECEVNKISKKIAIIDKRIKEITIYKYGFFGCIVMLPSITKTNEICHITRVKPDLLIIESESVPTLLSHIGHSVCSVNLKKITIIDNDNSYQNLAHRLSNTGKTNEIQRIPGIHLLEYKSDSKSDEDHEIKSEVHLTQNSNAA